MNEHKSPLQPAMGTKSKTPTSGLHVPAMKIPSAENWLRSANRRKTAILGSVSQNGHLAQIGFEAQITKTVQSPPVLFRKIHPLFAFVPCRMASKRKPAHLRARWLRSVTGCGPILFCKMRHLFAPTCAKLSLVYAYPCKSRSVSVNPLASLLGR